MCLCEPIQTYFHNPVSPCQLPSTTTSAKDSLLVSDGGKRILSSRMRNYRHAISSFYDFAANNTRMVTIGVSCTLCLHNNYDLSSRLVVHKKQIACISFSVLTKYKT